MCIPFRSNFSISALSATAWATTSAAASVISPNDRLSSWKKSCMREHCEMEETQRETKSWAAIVHWPWGLAVLLSGLQRGRQLPQNGPDSHQNWSLGCSWDASEPIRPSEFGDTVKHRIKVLSAYRKLLKKKKKRISPVPWAASPSWWKCCHWGWGLEALGYVEWLKLTPSHLSSLFHSGACESLQGCPSAVVKARKKLHHKTEMVFVPPKSKVHNIITFTTRHIYGNVKLNKVGVFCTWKALAKALAPSFSRRFLPAINTLSLSGAPRDDDCLWHSIRASAKIYIKHTNMDAVRTIMQIHNKVLHFYKSVNYIKKPTFTYIIWACASVHNHSKFKTRQSGCDWWATNINKCVSLSIYYLTKLFESSPFLHQSPYHNCWALAPSWCGRRGS